MTVPFRVALYYAPEPDDPLWQAGSSWLGRDPATGQDLAQPPLPDIGEVTAAPRHYGFHATLKPPMRLVPGTSWAAVEMVARALAASLAPFPLPKLAVTDLDGFLALCPATAVSPPLRALADAAVAGLDHFRAPSDETELARRQQSGLTAQQARLLARWGYPDVFDTWRFHMTLTRRLAGDDRGPWQAAAEAHFAPALAQPRRVESLALFTQSSATAPFRLTARLPLGARVRLSTRGDAAA